MEERTMNKLHLSTLAMALGVVGWAHAQTPSPQTETPATQSPTQTQTQSPAQTQQPGQTGAPATQPQSPQQTGTPPGTTTYPTHPAMEPRATQPSPGATQPGTAPTPTPAPGVIDPRPATSETEGTAADRTPPGQTPTRPVQPGTADPLPSTSPAEGTAADVTPPGQSTQSGAQMAMAGSMQALPGSKLIGMQVQSETGESLGDVKDVVLDPSSGKITHIIVSHSGTTGGAGAGMLSAVPWSAAQAGMQDGKLVLDSQRLQSAPSFPQSEWPQKTTETWSSDADQYWRSAGQSSGSAERG